MNTGEGFHEYTDEDDRSLNEALLDRYRGFDS